MKSDLAGAIEKYGKAFVALNIAFMAGVTLSGFIGLPHEIDAIRDQHNDDIASLTETVETRTIESDERMDKMDEYIDNLQLWVCIQSARNTGQAPEECANVGGDARGTGAATSGD